MISVAVMGALGKMGRETLKAVSLDDELELIGGVDPKAKDMEVIDIGGKEINIYPSRNMLDKNLPAVIVDFTRADVATKNIFWALEKGIHAVVGTTAISEEDVVRIKDEASKGRANVIIAPNFAIGAILMMKFAEVASKYFSQCEIIELHHRGKLDAPSGTAILTAKRVEKNLLKNENDRFSVAIEGSRGGNIGAVRIHSVRLDGLVAHQEVIFGSTGQTLSIRHDTIDRSCFMPGVVIAVKKVGETPGLTIGLDNVLGI
ncbi:MAG: 4-hydroxy-tetrahydrodipicolinate reductase [Actinomycetota bacterium]|nr:4-hydroxy-tetrahydrodipicolinate reductase [Actinomycetota bacterium]